MVLGRARRVREKPGVGSGSRNSRRLSQRFSEPDSGELQPGPGPRERLDNPKTNSAVPHLVGSLLPGGTGAGRRVRASRGGGVGRGGCPRSQDGDRTRGPDTKPWRDI